jgi:hypothetical protein
MRMMDSTRTRAAADEACIECDYGHRGGGPWGLLLHRHLVGECCANEFFRTQMKVEGVPTDAVARFGLEGSFRDYARQVLQAGPDSELGLWFAENYGLR